MAVEALDEDHTHADVTAAEASIQTSYNHQGSFGLISSRRGF
jgi:hypothetical protein